jgi:hypothetical protein
MKSEMEGFVVKICNGTKNERIRLKTSKEIHMLIIFLNGHTSNFLRGCKSLPH